MEKKNKLKISWPKAEKPLKKLLGFGWQKAEKTGKIGFGQVFFSAVLEKILFFLSKTQALI